MTMNAIIGEIITILDYSEEKSREGETYYSAYIGGSAIDEMDYFSEKEIPFVLLSKLGKDMQGETHLDYITSEYGIEEDDVLYSSSPSPVSIDGTLIIKGTAPSFIKRDEIVGFIEKNDIDKIIISSLLLSFDPVRKEIIEALEREKDKIKRVVIDAEDPTLIMMLEDLDDSIKRIAKAIPECYLAGDALTIDGVKRVSSDMIDSLF